ncbi:MAG: HNH endonuclease, partial [Actinomycetota bacterium]|nr:HNH endonuclease [Actinomycetota bacterium]
MCSSTGSDREQRIRSTLNAYPDDLGTVSDEDLDQGYSELQRIVQAVEAKKLRWLAEVERRAAFKRDGYLSTTDWLTDRFNLTRGSAKEQVKTAEALDALPEARTALEEGDVSPAAVRVLTAAWESHPEAFEANGSTLLEAAKTKPIGDLRRTVDDWRHRQDEHDGLDQARTMRERRRLDICPTASGMVRMGGDLDPEGGEYVMTALQAYVDSEITSGRVDLRTHRQLRADALVELARRYLGGGDRPTVGGDRPQVTVTVDLEVLRGLKEGTAELDHGTTVHPQTARRLACDASVRRIVLGPRSEPLDVGRKTPVWPAGIRRAVIARDKRCRWAGCDRPAAWCQVHHVKHWTDGGETCLANGVLLCV